jgi:transposase
MMRLSKHDLFQMDDEWLKKLPAELLLEVSKRLLHDVKELQDRLNRNPTNSSRPPTSQGAVGEGGRCRRGQGAPAESGRQTLPLTETAGRFAERDGKNQPAVANGPSPRKVRGSRPASKPGSPGHGRTQKLAVTATCEHRPESCAACGLALAADAESQAYTAWDEIDIAPPGRGPDRADVQCHASHAA